MTHKFLSLQYILIFIISGKEAHANMGIYFDPFSSCHRTIKHRFCIPSHSVPLFAQGMVLLLLVVTLVSCIPAVDSVTNVTSCTSLINNQCEQNLTSCAQPPCSLSCGRMSPHRSCIQDCVASLSNHSKEHLCDALECQASHYCSQFCFKTDCNSLTCTSTDCDQECNSASCGRMLCERNVTNCTQEAHRLGNAQIMDCSAKSCNQDCHQLSEEFFSELTCLFGVETCTQRGQGGKYNLRCLAGVKNCIQKAPRFSVANMQCNGDKCQQICSYSTCNMNCSAGVRECTQVEDYLAEHVTMNCDADVCIQNCGHGRCNMTCSSTVKECTQTCTQGTCSTRCDAEICHEDFGISTTTESVAPTGFNPTIKSNTSLKCCCFYTTLCLVLISLVIIT